jgi:hypothetical protein
VRAFAGSPRDFVARLLAAKRRVQAVQRIGRALAAANSMPAASRDWTSFRGENFMDRPCKE